MSKWSGYESAAGKGPLTFFFKILGPILLIIFVLGLVGIPLGWFSGATKVVQKEFGAEMLLKKYEWFKNASAELDKKRADIAVYEGRLSGLEQTYAKLTRERWPREDREQYNVWQSEVAGVKASYNSLAAEYNSQMSKFNWRFTNVGDLPPGATEPLPREVKPYVTQ